MKLGKDKSNKTDTILSGQFSNKNGLKTNINGSNHIQLKSSCKYFSTNTSCHNIIFLLLFFIVIINPAQNASVPPPVILVVSITSTNPLHMLFGIPPGPHVTTDISLSKLNCI